MENLYNPWEIRKDKLPLKDNICRDYHWLWIARIGALGAFIIYIVGL